MERNRLWRLECQEKGEEILCLTGLALYLGIFILLTTMFNTALDEGLLYRIGHMLLLLLFLFRCICCRSYTIKELCFIVPGILLMLFLWKVSGNGIVIDFFLLGAVGKGLAVRKLLWVYLITEITVFIVTVISSQIGVIPDLVCRVDRWGNLPGRALGYVYYADASAHVFFCICAWIALKGEGLVKRDGFLLLALAGLILLVFSTKTDAILVGVSALFVFLYASGKKAMSAWYRKYGMYIAAVCILAAVASVAVTAYYGELADALVWLDELLRHRLSLGKAAMDVYDVKMFGQTIVLQGHGGLTDAEINRLWDNEAYFFIDNSFVYIVLRYGLVMTVILLAGMGEYVRKSRREGNAVMGFLLVLIVWESILTCHYAEPGYNFLLLLPWAAYDQGCAFQKG